MDLSPPPLQRKKFSLVDGGKLCGWGEHWLLTPLVMVLCALFAQSFEKSVFLAPIYAYIIMYTVHFKITKIEYL